jgi:putative DNA primase/helicase
MKPDDVNAEGDGFEAIPFLRFDEAAIEIFADWRANLERRLRSGGISPALESHLAKYRKLVPSLALVIYLAGGGKGPVDDISTLRAVNFVTYLETHAVRLYSAGISAEAAAARAILARIRRGELADGFTARDVKQKDWAGLTIANDVQAALDLLTEYDWLVVEGCSTGGRPKLSYRINPRGRQ